MAIDYRFQARCGCAQHGGGLAPRSFAFPHTRRVYERARPFFIRHLGLALTLDTVKKSIQGSATLKFERVDPDAREICLDAVAFQIERVELTRKEGRAAADYQYDGDVLRVAIPASQSTGSITVVYSAVPQRGLYFLEPDDLVKDRPHQVWTQCQDEDARYWAPCSDKPHSKMTFELQVSVPKGWFALSNGALVAKEVKATAKRWSYHWKMDDPLPSYLLTLVAGEFSEIDGGAVGGIPLTYYVPKGREADGARTFARTADMMEHFGKLTGVPYPWNKYAQIVVSDFIFGGMENTTATTMYDGILLDERATLDISSDYLIAHELAHQWFGDYVTCRDWSHGWLNEGFATFFEHLDREHHLGRDEYQLAVRADVLNYLSEANGRYRRPIVCQDYDAPIDLFDRHLYEKGGLVLHMLRVRLGDPLFFKGVQHYLKKHARGIVETRDLMRALEEVSGQSLDQFFEQWVYRAGHPDLEVKVDYEDGLLAVHVKQLQKIDKENPTFSLSLPLEIVHAKGKSTQRTLQIDKQSESFSLPVSERPAYVVVDPDFAVLATVSLTAPMDMLRAQLVRATTGRGRWIAAMQLGKRPDAANIQALATCLQNEDEFWGVRSQAAESLGELLVDDAFAVLRSNAKVKHPKVRRAVVQALGNYHRPEAALVLKPLALKDASYVVEAEAARALGHTKQPSAFDTLMDVVDRPSWTDLIRAGAIDGLAALRDDRAILPIAARTRYGGTARARRSAIAALPKLTSDRKYREVLEELLLDRDPHLKEDVARALLEMGDQKSRPALSRQLERETDGRVKRRIREVLADLGATSKRDSTDLKDELDKLKTEHAELLSRITKLETSQPKKKRKG